MSTVPRVQGMFLKSYHWFQISSATGYNFAKFFSLHGRADIPLWVYFFSELSLAVSIRDNLTLILLQLFAPVDV
jgi:hypothetical protein